MIWPSRQNICFRRDPLMRLTSGSGRTAPDGPPPRAYIFKYDKSSLRYATFLPEVCYLFPSDVLPNLENPRAAKVLTHLCPLIYTQYFQY